MNTAARNRVMPGSHHLEDDTFRKAGVHVFGLHRPGEGLAVTTNDLGSRTLGFYTVYGVAADRAQYSQASEGTDVWRVIDRLNDASIPPPAPRQSEGIYRLIFGVPLARAADDAVRLLAHGLSAVTIPESLRQLVSDAVASSAHDQDEEEWARSLARDIHRSGLGE